jgi:hypothetical protein
MRLSSKIYLSKMYLNVKFTHFLLNITINHRQASKSNKTIMIENYAFTYYIQRNSERVVFFRTCQPLCVVTKVVSLMNTNEPQGLK